MIVAVASGKGGTGKTTVALSLALVAAEDGGVPVTLLDCDAEAPNAALFLDPGIEEERDAGVLVPEVDLERCEACGRCAHVCQFHALAAFGGPPLLFPDLCHGCGSCVWACPRGALSERLEVTGRLRAGRAAALSFAEARLHVGRAMAAPIIRQLKEWRLPRGMREELAVIDAPPGTACAAMEAVRGADVALLVAESSPFGLHDLAQAVEVFRDALGIPVGVVLNRVLEPDSEADSEPESEPESDGGSEVERFCASAGVPVLGRIPFDRRIAEVLSEGVPLVRARPGFRAMFRDIWESLGAEAAA